MTKNIGDEEAKYIGEALLKNTTSREFNLCSNKINNIEITDKEIDKLCNFIKTKRIEITDEELSNIILDKYNLNFGICRQIDNMIYKKGGGYFRNAYNFPNDGDVVSVPLLYGGIRNAIVNNAGFFTMNINNRR